MYKIMMNLLKLLPIFICLLIVNTCAAGNIDQNKIEDIVNNSVQPVLREYNIPGMAIAITVDGKHYFYNYGVASKETLQPVTSETIFEIGSLSKTFTATLASYAQINGKLALLDNVSKYLPDLRGSSFDSISLLNLGTHTSGGLPLQVPENINNTEQLMAYFRNWQPTYEAGVRRCYSNPSIGMLGMITAKNMNESFEGLIEKRLFAELGMINSFINVPADKMRDYAQGYNTKDVPVRLNDGVLASEAYGVKSSSADLIKFIEANMQLIKLDKKLQRAIDDTHIGYFKAGEMTQALIWEKYPYPVSLQQLLLGNSAAMIYQGVRVTKLTQSSKPQGDVFINKTGSTDGFGAYAAFIPAKKIGIVILANKSYPIDARLVVAYQILTQLED